jgi:hypothetical protein
VRHDKDSKNRPKQQSLTERPGLMVAVVAAAFGLGYVYAYAIQQGRLFSVRPTFSSNLSGQWVEIALVLLLLLSWWMARTRPFMSEAEAYALVVSALFVVPIAEPAALYLGVTNHLVIIAGCVAFVLASLAVARLVGRALAPDSERR